MNELTDLLYKTLSNANFLNAKQLKDYLKDYQFSEVHCIEIINHLENANVTKIAEAAHMTRGGISKITKKLITRGAIESYQAPENKKEIYFKLTEIGRDMVRRHNEIHKMWEERDNAVVNMISENESKIIISFLNKFNQHIEAEIKKLDEK
ncbi:MAG: MarR family transcriptional regulator [Herbinix sp.]|nr:MarR family transcriptional regulator [Herbinix sp.]